MTDSLGRFQSQTGSLALSDSLLPVRMSRITARFNPRREASPFQTAIPPAYTRWIGGFNPRREASPFQTSRPSSIAWQAAPFQSQTGSLALSDFASHHASTRAQVLFQSQTGSLALSDQNSVKVYWGCSPFQSQTGSLALSDGAAHVPLDRFQEFQSQTGSLALSDGN